MSRLPQHSQAKILDEGSPGVDWPLIRSKGLLIQEFLMADLHPLSGASLTPRRAAPRRGKRRRLIRGRRHFCASKYFFRKTMPRDRARLQKGEFGQRVRERWNKRTDNGRSKNTRAEKKFCAYLVPGHGAFVLGAREIIRRKAVHFLSLQEPLLNFIALLDKISMRDIAQGRSYLPLTLRERDRSALNRIGIF